MSDGYSPRRFSRPWWFEGIRTFGWVSLVTVLIWVYADMKFTETRKFSLTLVLASQKGGLELLGRANCPVSFEAQGSRETLDRIERELGPEVEVDVSDMGPGDHKQPTQDLLSRVSVLSNVGIRFVSVDPAVVSIQLDPEVQVADVPVDLNVTGAELAPGWTISPPKVSITLGRSRLAVVRRALDGKELRLQTMLIDLSDEPQDVTIKRVVDINPVLAGQKMSVSPSQVEATAQVLQKTAPPRAFQVKVKLQFPPTWIKDNTWLNYDFQARDDYWYNKEVTVSGPRQTIEQLKSEDIDAYLPLSEDDKAPLGVTTGTWIERPVQFRFPPGANVKIEGPRPTISFNLVPRTLAPATGVSASPSGATPAGPAPSPAILPTTQPATVP